jgi:hypothetical protein
MLVRRTAARTVRDEATTLAHLRPHATHLTNGEESAYRSPPPLNQLTYIANYSKGLPHNGLGEVDVVAYQALRTALASGTPADFEAIPLGGGRPLVNPQAGLAFDLEGPDAHSLAIPPAPRIDSAEVAGEMAELYWMALLRDVKFADFAADPNVAAAAASLSAFSDFRGPKVAGQVTPDTIFRGITPGDLVGPFVSQFLLVPVRFGTLTISQRQQTAQPAVDYLMDFPGWLASQNGGAPAGPDVFDPIRRYIRTMRDLATYVHFDALHEAYFNACLILLDLGAPLDPGNPYAASATQLGFGTFGGPHILTLLTEVATRALKAVWFQKWYVHRRLRPEAFGGLIHNHVTGAAAYPIHPDILDLAPGSVLDRIHAFNQAQGHNTYLLPQAFPEGSPTHPAYGAGHATVAGACVTILKAWFDESFVLASPVVPNPAPIFIFPEGTLLVPYAGPGANALTVGGELNKLAANIAIGRNMAGVHWRSDYTASIMLGEAVALGLLEEQKQMYNEPHSLTLTKFDGTTITI